jgi:heat shock protein HtpX
VLGIEQWLWSHQIYANLSSLLIFCAAFGFGGAFVALLMSKTMAKMSSRTRVIDQPRTADEQWLVTTVTELAAKAGIKTPEVGIFPAQQANAFATGWNKNAALVAVSEGLLYRFNRDEAKAVLGHEIGHVANGDMVTLTLIQGVVNTFVMFFARVFGNIIDKAVFKNERGNGPAFWITTMIAEMVLGIVATMIVMWFSRWREFRADRAGADLAGRQAMIHALQRLKGDYDRPNEMPQTMQAFGINGGFKSSAARLFMSHPPLDERIEALIHGGQ